MKTITINAANATREFEGNDMETAISVLSHAAVRSFFGFGTADSQAEINEALDTLIPHILAITSGNSKNDLTKQSEGFRKALLNATLEDGAVIDIDYYAAEDNNANDVDNDGFDPTAENNDDEPTDEDYARSHEALGGDEDDDDDVSGPETHGKALDEQAPVEQGTAGPVKHGFVVVNANGGLTSTRVEIEDGVTTIQSVIYSDIVLKRSGMDETAMSNCMVQLEGDTISPRNIATRALHSGETIDLVPRYAANKG